MSVRYHRACCMYVTKDKVFLKGNSGLILTNGRDKKTSEKWPSKRPFLIAKKAGNPTSQLVDVQSGSVR